MTKRTSLCLTALSLCALLALLALLARVIVYWVID